MKILFCWHAAVEPEYRKLFYKLSKLGVELLALLPDKWVEGGRLQRADGIKNSKFELLALPIIFRNRIRAFFYPRLDVLIYNIRSFKPDIAHIFEEPYSIVSAQLVFLLRILSPKTKIIIQSFENIFLQAKFPFSEVEKYVLNNVDAIIVVPHEGINIWRLKGFKRYIYQLPIGVDEELFQRVDSSNLFDLPNGKVKIGYVGRLIKEKGIYILLQAFEGLVKEGFDIGIVFAGSGHEKRALNDKISALKLTRKAKIFDALPSSLLPYFYSKIDIFVLPSITTSKWKEQFGRVLIEAMACNVAVVGSSSGEIPYIIKDVGFIFPEGDVNALKNILRELIMKPDLRKHLGNVGRKTVLEKFTWDVVSSKLYKIYKEVKGD